MESRVVFEGVWKRFRRGQSHDSLRDLIPSLTRRLVGRGGPVRTDREFWALSDLSFDVGPGEVLGIIGANGAGKSTTLKILNRIMEPTRGVAAATGNIGALIEVSAGFHHDLTGRQNVFLQGAIMGMRQREVEQKFDDIVDFAGISEFIDTPVKRYSSGMNARLGFAIAAHLEPDILIIDEVLAVGDHAFQQRAFGRIKAMATGGMPVVLVSHQLDRIAELCTKAILLERGRVRAEGSAMRCINEYLHGVGGVAGSGELETGVRFDSIAAPNGLAVYSGNDLHVVARGTVVSESLPSSWIPALRVIDTGTGAHVHFVAGPDRGVSLDTRGSFTYDLLLQMNLTPGLFNVELCVWDTEHHHDVVTSPRLQVEVLERQRFWGGIQLNARWTSRAIGSGD